MDNVICRICGNPISLNKDSFEMSSLEGSAHIDCIKRKENEDWYNSMKTLFNVDELKQENQALKDRWKKLKEFMQSEHDWGLENDYQDCAYGIRLILDKIQELEQGEADAKD